MRRFRLIPGKNVGSLHIGVVIPPKPKEQPAPPDDNVVRFALPQSVDATGALSLPVEFFADAILRQPSSSVTSVVVTHVTLYAIDPSDTNGCAFDAWVFAGNGNADVLDPAHDIWGTTGYETDTISTIVGDLIVDRDDSMDISSTLTPDGSAALISIPDFPETVGAGLIIGRASVTTDRGDCILCFATQTCP